MGSTRELSMADHDKPTVTSNYLDFVSEMHGRMDDLAVGFDPARTSATNVPNYSIRWSSVAKKWQYLDGSSWKDLTNEYAINISGSATKLKNARTISITGGGTAQPVPFDGSADVQLTLESLDLANLTGLGSAAGVDVVQGTGNSEDDVMSQKAVTDAIGAKADKTITIDTGLGLEGGGSLAANRTIELSGATKASLEKAETALQGSDKAPADHGARHTYTGMLVTADSSWAGGESIVGTFIDGENRPSGPYSNTGMTGTLPWTNFLGVIFHQLRESR